MVGLPVLAQINKDKFSNTEMCPEIRFSTDSLLAENRTGGNVYKPLKSSFMVSRRQTFLIKNHFME